LLVAEVVDMLLLDTMRAAVVPEDIELPPATPLLLEHLSQSLWVLAVLAVRQIPLLLRAAVLHLAP
jgi:hypothetical protein